MYINQMIVLFGLMAVGYIISRLGYLDEVANEKISKLIVNVTIPATILNSAINQKINEKSNVIFILVIAIVYFIIFSILSKILCDFFKLEKTLRLMLTYSNLGFMGIPIVSSIYGEDKVFYVVLFMMIFNISIFSHGLYVLQSGTEKRMESWKEKVKIMMNPGILSAILAMIILLFDIPVLSSISNIIGSISTITTPLAMLAIGSSLALIPMKSVLLDKKMYLFAFLKLFVYPVVALAILKLCGIEKELSGIVVIMTCLPTAGNVSMICSEYQGDTAVVSKGICISTIASIVAIPFWIWICSIL